MPVLATTKRQQQLFYDHYTGKRVLVSIPLTTVEFVAAELYCTHAFADGN